MRLVKIDLPFRINEPILAVGADVKNSICLAYERFAFVSEAINDLEVLENFNRFKNNLAAIPRQFGLKPKIIAFDKHPEYFSTKYILNLPKKKGVRLFPVQHHHAHIASCMLENKLKKQKVIGVAFDGTGIGNDYTLWGAEFLVADYRSFHRAAHLRYIPLLGGRKAIYEPWRLALAWLCLAFGDKALGLDLDFIKHVDKKDWLILEKMWKQNFNTPLSSSIGRLFDAVAVLLLGINKVKFEAEAAIKLERLALGYKRRPRCYKFKINKQGEVLIIDPVPALKGIVADLKRGSSKEKIAAGFHLTVARMIQETCVRLRDSAKINTVVLSGGVFQNKMLFKLSTDLLQEKEFCVLTHNRLPCSDASISLGQAAVAA